jgi:hypothetical protein
LIAITKMPMHLIGFSVRLTLNTLYAISSSFREVLPWQALQIHKVFYEVVFLDATSETCAQKSTYVNIVYCTLYIILHLSTILSHTQTHPLFLVAQCIDLMQRGAFDSWKQVKE